MVVGHDVALVVDDDARALGAARRGGHLDRDDGRLHGRGDGLPVRRVVRRARDGDGVGRRQAELGERAGSVGARGRGRVTVERGRDAERRAGGDDRGRRSGGHGDPDAAEARRAGRGRGGAAGRGLGRLRAGRPRVRAGLLRLRAGGCGRGECRSGLGLHPGRLGCRGGLGRGDGRCRRLRGLCRGGGGRGLLRGDRRRGRRGGRRRGHGGQRLGGLRLGVVLGLRGSSWSWLPPLSTIHRTASCWGHACTNLGVPCEVPARPRQANARVEQSGAVHVRPRARQASCASGVEPSAAAATTARATTASRASSARSTRTSTTLVAGARAPRAPAAAPSTSTTRVCRTPYPAHSAATSTPCGVAKTRSNTSARCGLAVLERREDRAAVVVRDDDLQVDGRLDGAAQQATHVVQERQVAHVARAPGGAAARARRPVAVDTVPSIPARPRFASTSGARSQRATRSRSRTGFDEPTTSDVLRCAGAGDRTREHPAGDPRAAARAPAAGRLGTVVEHGVERAACGLVSREPRSSQPAGAADAALAHARPAARAAPGRRCAPRRASPRRAGRRRRPRRPARASSACTGRDSVGRPSTTTRPHAAAEPLVGEQQPVGADRVRPAARPEDGSASSGQPLASARRARAGPAPSPATTTVGAPGLPGADATAVHGVGRRAVAALDDDGHDPGQRAGSAGLRAARRTCVSPSSDGTGHGSSPGTSGSRNARSRCTGPGSPVRAPVAAATRAGRERRRSRVLVAAGPTGAGTSTASRTGAAEDPDLLGGLVRARAAQLVRAVGGEQRRAAARCGAPRGPRGAGWPTAVPGRRDDGHGTRRRRARRRRARTPCASPSARNAASRSSTRTCRRSAGARRGRSSSGARASASAYASGALRDPGASTTSCTPSAASACTSTRAAATAGPRSPGPGCVVTPAIMPGPGRGRDRATCAEPHGGNARASASSAAAAADAAPRSGLGPADLERPVDRQQRVGRRGRRRAARRWPARTRTAARAARPRARRPAASPTDDSSADDTTTGSADPLGELAGTRARPRAAAP